MKPVAMAFVSPNKVVVLHNKAVAIAVVVAGFVVVAAFVVVADMGTLVVDMDT